MNTFKKLLGYVWMLLSPAIILFLIYEAVVKIAAASEASKANTILQWVIILLIFLPITIGFFIFGKYASQNEYEHLPESSSEIMD
jgi:ABC-type polysaccharide/polyol phosphate export permease